MAQQKRNADDPVRWRITEWNGALRTVESGQAPPLMPGETPVWEGAARHVLESYRRARESGLPICLGKDGFKLRKPNGSQARDVPTPAPADRCGE